MFWPHVSKHSLYLVKLARKATQNERKVGKNHLGRNESEEHTDRETNNVCLENYGRTTQNNVVMEISSESNRDQKAT